MDYSFILNADRNMFIHCLNNVTTFNRVKSGSNQVYPHSIFMKAPTLLRSTSKDIFHLKYTTVILTFDLQRQIKAGISTLRVDGRTWVLTASLSLQTLQDEALITHDHTIGHVRLDYFALKRKLIAHVKYEARKWEWVHWLWKWVLVIWRRGEKCKVLDLALNGKHCTNGEKFIFPLVKRCLRKATIKMSALAYQERRGERTFDIPKCRPRPVQI